MASLTRAPGDVEPPRLELAGPGDDRPPFVLSAGGRCVAFWLSPADHAGVRRAAADLSEDVERVSGARPSIHESDGQPPDAGVWIGTLGRHSGIDALAERGRIDVAFARGRRECWLLEHVELPDGSGRRVLVIAGSDKRGAIYGVYELSEMLGVSPWYYWADVPVARRAAVAFGAGRRRGDEPEVRYRGIFLNDEEPALGRWAREKCGGFGREFYGRVFELLLRLRANFLWPAMWGSAFNEDDPENAALADHYGVVMGTSHHEPMLRSQQEWKRHGEGPWHYGANGDALRAFWRYGIERNKAFESVITLGMRGDGDMPMSSAEDRALLERVIADQLAILKDVHGEDCERLECVWALYKEVQAYLDQGMVVPDAVTLLFCDDNWGNIRRLPAPWMRSRSGGSGIYYHYDYVGGPRSYKWLCTVPLSKTWQQMLFAFEHGAARLWIVNVGDLKPMELATQFFLDLARRPSAMTLDVLADYPRAWAASIFGAEHSAEIGALMTTQLRFISRRKPELLEPDTFSLIDYREAERVLGDYRELERRAEAQALLLGEEHAAAYFQLVSFPIQICANLVDLHVSVGKNRLYALQGRASTNAWSERARKLFQRDVELTRRYNEELSGGKWRHMMDQNHIGYSGWQQPVANALPPVTELALPHAASLGVAIEGAPHAWPTDDPNQRHPVLPALDPIAGGTRWVDIFNRGTGDLEFNVTASVPWLCVTPQTGRLSSGFDSECRVEVGVDWSLAPQGEHFGRLKISGPAAQCVEVVVPMWQPASEASASPSASLAAHRDGRRCLHVFAEGGRRVTGDRPASADPTGRAALGRLGGGYVSIEAEHFSRAVPDQEVSWRVIQGHGRTLSGVTPFPASVSPRKLGADAPRLEYCVWLKSQGQLEVTLYFSPSLDAVSGRGLACAVSFDDAEPERLDLLASGGSEGWARMVKDSVRKVSFGAFVSNAGEHVLKLWMIDPGLILEKVVIDCGGLAPSYLGPPESAVCAIACPASSSVDQARA